MPRVGRHPLKGLRDSIECSKNITVTTIVYIPTLSGYWNESLEILKLFFSSLLMNTAEDFDLMVFDNGSCAEVQQYLIDLKNKQVIQYLILSQYNLRKTGALNHILSTAPGEYIAYADSDICFLPDWLSKSIEILDAYPEAGKVTAIPIVMDQTSSFYTSVYGVALRTVLKDQSIKVEEGLLVPDYYLDAHRMSLGESNEQYARRLKIRNDVRITRGGVQALLSGADHQFTIRKNAIRAILPLTVNKPEEQGDSIYSPILEYRLAEKGYWQLSTTDYYIHHMGNHIPNFRQELSWLGENSLPSADGLYSRRRNDPKQKNKLLMRLRYVKPVREILKMINLISYKMLYE